MFSSSKWEGLAKIGKYEVNSKSFTTPALFPVVDPFQQNIEIQRMKTDFGFDQVITSSYLMSKRFSTTESGVLKLPNFGELPSIESYLNYDGVIMMDSGAYQVMLYGDIELGVTDTLELQMNVETDIGVIMDHPIGYNVPYNSAKKRIDTTLTNLKTSIEYFRESKVHWTLPIQGGKYIDLLDYYLDKVLNKEILDHFSMFALGSVVPVMINQDYNTLVKMIATARSRLPASYPLHLFGAGHPAMFALATFLGCDPFDSAAYALMAKDGRYLTVDGTLQLENIDEFPCSCKICSTYTVKEFKALEKHNKFQLLSEHNLWESIAEIKRIREAIKMGRLWDLVQQRANSVPRLARATRLATEFVITGSLSKLHQAGTPSSLPFAPRITKKSDLLKVDYLRIKKASNQIILDNNSERVIIIAYSMIDSIYSKLVDDQLSKILKNEPGVQLLLLLPPFGLVPIGLNEIYPVAQVIHELDMISFDFVNELKLINNLFSRNTKKIDIILPEDWPRHFYEKVVQLSGNITVHVNNKPFSVLKNLFQ